MYAEYIDINCDMGEGFGPYAIGNDGEVMKHITSANVACGFHAGDPMTINKTIRLAIQFGVAVGAHPGYPDRMNFGRRRMECSQDEIRNYLIYQIGAMKSFCNVYKIRFQHVKLHGALYHAAMSDAATAETVASVISDIDREIIYVAQPNSKGAQIAKDAKLQVIYEAFPDRGYLDSGELAPREWADSVIEDPKEVALRALMIARDGIIVALNDRSVDMHANTLCIHGDNPAAPEIAKEIRKTLSENNIKVRSMR